MPSPQIILAQLEQIAGQLMPLAIVWHLITAAALIALAARWRPSRRLAGTLLAAPVASASAIALAFRNPFNALVLGALAIALLVLGLRLDRTKVAPAAAPWAAIGAVMIGFAWIYPHFLDSAPATTYLFAAPLGLIPCPTLSLVIGFALLGGGLQARAWSLTLVGIGFFYALFGMGRLGVQLDSVLAGGATALLIVALLRPGSRASRAGALPAGAQPAPPAAR